MLVPIIKAFSIQYPEVKITLISRPFHKPLFDSVENFSFFEVDFTKKHRGFLGLIKLFFELKSKKIDLFVDFHHVLRTILLRVLFTLFGIKTAYTPKCRNQKKELTKLDPNKKIFPLPSIIERHCITLEKIGFALDINKYIPQKNIPLTHNILDFTGDKKNKWIGIAPFAQHDSKVYPFHLMKKVITLLSINNYNLFLFGSKNDTTTIEALISNQKNCFNIAGKYSFKEELILISNLDVMLSMDSANGHLAANFGIPVVTLWGATHPFLGFIPFNQPLSNSLIPDRKQYPLLPTSVYGNKKVQGYEKAMETIMPNEVVKKIESLL